MKKLLPLLLMLMLPVPVAEAKVAKGPAGDAFYTPPAKLPGSTHGDAIWQRRTGAKTLLLYRSTRVDGKAIAVSGTVELPKGRSPRGGWPLLTWGHGTRGLADSCAPSKGYGNFAEETTLLAAWRKRGYAIARTDYEGLGTPGVHPYLVGRSEARGMLDIARAARRAYPSIGEKVVIAGESQGGQSALWAAAEARKWTPELDVRGTLAFAPISKLADQARIFPTLESSSPNLPAYAAMILRGIDTAYSNLDIASALSDRTRPLYPFVDTDCQTRLEQPDRFGSVKPKEFFRDGADLSPGYAALEANDAGTLKIRTAVHIAQGTADGTVLKPWTDELVQKLRAKGAKVAYETYEGAGHGSDLLRLAKARSDALAFSRRRAGR